MKQALDELQVFWVPARNSRHELRLVELAIAPHEAKKGLAFDPRELSGKFDDDAFIFTKDRGGINRMEQAISPRAQKAMGGPEKKMPGYSTSVRSTTKAPPELSTKIPAGCASPRFSK